MHHLQGVFNILATPFNEDMTLDEYSIESLIDFQLQSGVSGLTILGVMSEVSKLSDDERHSIMEITFKRVKGKVPIIVNATANGTNLVIEFAKKAQDMGAAGIMLSPPSNLKNLDGVKNFYQTVSKSLSVPIVAQDLPSNSNVFMPASFLADLNMPYIKLEEPPVPQKITSILQKNNEIGIFGGLGAQFFLEELERGAIGTMMGFGYTDILVEIFDDFKSGNKEQAKNKFFQIAPLTRFEGQIGVGLAIRKQILKRRGAIKHSAIRNPGIKMDSIAHEELERVLDFLGLLVK